MQCESTELPGLLPGKEIRDKNTLHSLCQSAIKASMEAGQFIQSQVNQPYSQQDKQGGSSNAFQVVTEVDFKAQEMILRLIH
nr:hypothetical protein [Cytophagales bacterium]